ncbi:MAG: histidine--tRNA ligase [Anaerolineales bacterium]
MSTIQAVRGTRDFYPEDMVRRQWLYGHIRGVSEQFGYQEYDGPFLEKLELYAAKSGDELVKEQSYVFSDRSGTMIALRPELTLSLARMVAEISKSALFPLRWWSFGPFWRYERTQKGRSREFFQWNIDLLGVDAPQADAEMIAIAATLFRRVGLRPDQIRIKVNNRKLAESRLHDFGIEADQRAFVFHLIDRRDKMSEAAWRDYALEGGLNSAAYDALVSYLSNDDGWNHSSDLAECLEACGALGVEEYVEYDPSVIRGLDYYTGTVYEARDVKGHHRSILGGGRYDNLVADVGGDRIPGTGFAMGDIVFSLVLEENGVVPDLKTNPAQVFVTSFDESTISESMEVSAELRRAGFSAEWYPEPARLQRQFKYADRQGIPVAVILGPEEIAQGTVAIKDLVSGEQRTISRSELIQTVQSILASEEGK